MLIIIALYNTMCSYFILFNNNNTEYLKMLRANVLFMIILMICVAESCAIACVKKYHRGDGFMYFPVAVALYAIVCYLLNRSFYYKDSMGITNVIWSGVSVLMVALVGILMFHETLHFHDLLAASFITMGLLIIKYTE
jgi:multidrug transporter EmrE-like cation transporter